MGCDFRDDFDRVVAGFYYSVVVDVLVCCGSLGCVVCYGDFPFVSHRRFRGLVANCSGLHLSQYVVVSNPYHILHYGFPWQTVFILLLRNYDLRATHMSSLGCLWLWIEVVCEYPKVAGRWADCAGPANHVDIV